MAEIHTRPTSILRLIVKPGSLGWVGGFARFKQWAFERSHAFTEKGIAYGLTPPRGQLIVGVPGTGKSLAAKAIGNLWNVPVYWLDVGSILGSFLGESERNLRGVFEEAADHSPCVVWIDELDRSLSVGPENDSGVTSRIVAGLLTWLQERREPVFISATANRVKHLPQELIRPGRFDVVWGVGLPDHNERVEILRIHLRKRARKSSDFNLYSLSQVMDGLTGAEIEAVIVDAFYIAFMDKSNVKQEHIETALKRVVPQSRRFFDELVELEEWMARSTVMVGG